MSLPGRVFCFFWLVGSITGSTSAFADPINFGGITFAEPRGWEIQDRAELRNALRHRSALIDVDSLVFVWRRATRCGMPSKIAYARSSGKVTVSRSDSGRVRALVEKGMQGSPAVRDFEIHAVEVLHVDGIPAYRIRLSFRSGDDPIDQTIYLLGATSTHILTFSSPRECHAENLAEFEEVIESVTLTRRPRLSLEASFWLWSLLFAAVIGTSLAGRKDLRVPVVKAARTCSRRVFR